MARVHWARAVPATRASVATAKAVRIITGFVYLGGGAGRRGVWRTFRRAGGSVGADRLDISDPRRDCECHDLVTQGVDSEGVRSQSKCVQLLLRQEVCPITSYNLRT